MLFRSVFSGTAKINSLGDSVRVELHGFGGIAYDTINVNYFFNPTIKISYPAILSHDTNTSIITISGTTNNSRLNDTVAIFTNTSQNTFVYITANNGVFSGTAKINSLGDSVRVELHGFGGIAYDTINVNYFSNPSIKITYPLVFDTTFQVITIKGTTLNSKTGDSILISNNSINPGVFVLADTIQFLNASWSSNVLLASGYNTVVIAMKNYFNDTYFDTIIINYIDTTSLGIKIVYPFVNNFYETNSQYITITGTTKSSRPGDTIYAALSVGREYYFDSVVTYKVDSFNSTFAFNLQLKHRYDTTILGFPLSVDTIVNHVIVTLLSQDNTFSSTRKDSIVIHYYGNPVISITSPVNYTDTNQSSILIKGTTKYTHYGDSIEIFTKTADTINLIPTDSSGIKYPITSQYQYGFNFWEINNNLYDFADSVIIKLTDKFGTVVWDTKHINYYRAPELKIISIKSDTLFYDTDAANIYMHGTTKNTYIGDSILISLNGIHLNTSAILSRNGNWAYTVNLSSEYNTIAIKVLNKFNDFSIDTSVIKTVLKNNLSGTVTLSGLQNHSCSITLVSNSINTTISSDSIGYFSFINFPSDTYTITISKTAFKNVVYQNVYIDSSYALTNIKLVGGDLNQSGEITIEDLGILLVNFGKQVASPLQGDINQSGWVTEDDYSILINNIK